MAWGAAGDAGRGEYGIIEGVRRPVCDRARMNGMNKRTLAAGAVGMVAVAGLGLFLWNSWAGQKASAQAPRNERTVPVVVAKAVKKPVPVRIEALGTVTTMAS